MAVVAVVAAMTAGGGVPRGPLLAEDDLGSDAAVDLDADDVPAPDVPAPDAPSADDPPVMESPTGPDDPTGDARTPEADDDPDGWPVAWRDPSHTVLVFDDGLEGAVAVDLDTGNAAVLDLPQRAGDQPFRIRRVGDEVVVGWGRIHAVSLAGPEPDARLLAEATVFVPAAEPDRVWVIEHDGDHIGRQQAAWRLLDLSGRELAAREPPHPEVTVLRGVPGGLAVRDTAGRVSTVLVDPDRRHAGSLPPDAQVADATADAVAWCVDPCRRVQVEAIDGRSSAVGGDLVRSVDPSDVWLSPDGSRLAVIAMVDTVDNAAVDRELRIHTLDTGSVLARRSLPLGTARGSWHPDGDQFFVTVTGSPGTTGGPQLLGRWRANGGIERLTVPDLGPLGDFVALDRADVDLGLRGPEVDRPAP